MRRAIGVAAVGLTIVATSCTTGGRHADPVEPARSSPAAAGAPRSPAVAPSPLETCADRVLNGMTDGQRIGQLFLIGMSPLGLGPAIARAIRAWHFGSVTLAGKTDAGAAAVRRVTETVQRLATRATTHGVRFFVAANQEGGAVLPLRGPGLSEIPAGVDQGELPTAKLQRDARMWGRQLAETGVNLDLAPVADVVPVGTAASNPPIGAVGREFGSDPDDVGSHAAAFVRGMNQSGVATVVKHFPGLGRVHANTDFAHGVIDPRTGRHDRLVRAFEPPIEAGAPFVMISLVTYPRIDPGRLAVFSPAVMRDMLRSDLGFTGVVVSDTLGDSVAVRPIPPGDAAIRFLSAGGDLITSDAVEPAEAMAHAIAGKERRDAAFAARVRDAARRVLAAKERFGLLPCGSR